MAHSTKYRQLWRNMAYNDPVWPVIVQNDQLWIRISSMAKYGHVLPILIKFGQAYKMSSWIFGTLCQKWTNVAQNSPIYANMFWYDYLCPSGQYYHFWPTLVHYVTYDHIWDKMPSKKKNEQKLSIIIQYGGMINDDYAQLWPSLLLYYQFWPILKKCVRIDYCYIRYQPTYVISILAKRFSISALVVTSL